MLLNLQQKKNFVLRLKDKLIKSKYIILIKFLKFKVNDLNKLRLEINKYKKLYLVVLKNKLFKLAIQNTKYNFLNKYIVGSMILFCSYNITNKDILWNILINFILNNKKNLVINAFVYNNKLISLKIVNKLIKYNTIDKAFIYFINYLKNISIVRLLNVLLIIKNNK